MDAEKQRQRSLRIQAILEDKSLNPHERILEMRRFLKSSDEPDVSVPKVGAPKEKTAESKAPESRRINGASLLDRLNRRLGDKG